MKKLLLTFIFTSLLICCSTNEDSPVIDHPIVGKWFFKEAVEGDEIYVYSHSATCPKDYMEWSAKGIARLYDFQNSTCTAEIDVLGRYTIENDILTYTDSPGDEPYMILEVTDTILRLKHIEKGGGPDRIIIITYEK